MSELSRTMLRNDADEPPRLALRPREAARALGVSERLLWSLTNRDLIPHVRLGNKCIVYPVAALRAWLDKQAQQKGGDG